MAFSNLLKTQIHTSIHEISADAWNACVSTDDPFSRHEFLSALEDSQCVHRKTGWMGQHLALYEQDRLMGCAILYLKSHSYGEYVFDWSWADAYERAGGRYYPKLQCAVPFTPVSGHRLLCHPDATERHKNQLISALLEHAKSLNVSSLHVTFARKEECEAFTQHGFHTRVGHQYHWDNHDYQTFDDFLAALSSSKRKSIRKERRKVQDSGIELKTLNGAEIEEHHWDAFFEFYMDTSGRKWGHPYLNRPFFSMLGERLGETIVLVLAYEGEKIIAGALNLKGNQTLYGRYWGCLEDYKFLHFEACYYQAIEYAIRHNLLRVEAGAQGQHKIQRGYLPTETYSAHWLKDSAFEQAVKEFLAHDLQVNQLEMHELSKLSPYKLNV